MIPRSLSFIKSINRNKPDGEIPSINGDFDLDGITNKSGVYIILSDKEKFIYPTGKSQVIYIGMSKNIKARIETHAKSFSKLMEVPKSRRRDFWYYSRYNYMVNYGCKVYWFTRRGEQTSKDLESIIIEDFYNRYHSIPIGNGAFSFRSIK